MNPTDVNIKIFQRLMRNIQTDINGFYKDSRSEFDFNRKVGSYVQTNPVLTEKNIVTTMEAITGVSKVFDSQIPGTIPNGTREVMKEVIRQHTDDYIRSMGEDTRIRVKNILQESIDNNKGRNWAKNEMVKEIKTIDKTRARAIARTETTRARSLARYSEARVAGKDYFIVLPNDSCCSVCAETYPGNVFHAVDDMDMMPPIHVNCDCDVTYIRDENHAEALAAAIDDKNDWGAIVESGR